ncbi:MAG: hypothetical protein ACO1TE_27495 [Prosthecobacter sp.]
MKTIYIKADDTDLFLMSERPEGGALPLMKDTGGWKAFRRDVYDEVVRSLSETTSDPQHTATRRKLANALRFEQDTVKISIADATELLNQATAEELTRIFEVSEQVCARKKEEKNERIAAVADKFQKLFFFPKK